LKRHKFIRPQKTTLRSHVGMHCFPIIVLILESIYCFSIDHGKLIRWQWARFVKTCSSRRCKKRLSTFSAIVSTNQTFSIYLTATPPKQLRLRILDKKIGMDWNSKLIIGVFYFTSHRIDVYKNGVYVPPTNASYSQNGMSSGVSSLGDNFFDKPSGMVYLCV